MCFPNSRNRDGVGTGPIPRSKYIWDCSELKSENAGEGIYLPNLALALRTCTGVAIVIISPKGS